MSVSETKWVRLGEYIELNMTRNSKGIYGEADAVGVNIEKIILPMRGNIESKDFNKFFLVPPKSFAYNPRGSRKLGIALNLTQSTYIITFNDVVFRIKPNKENELHPEFLFIFLSRKEWDRYAEYLSWGSSTEVFSWDTFCDIKIPLPSIEVQRELVDTYNGLKSLAEQNEALLSKISDACHAYIVDCRAKYPAVPLGDYIEQCDERNINNYYNEKNLRGVTNEGVFNSSRANIIGLNFSNYKIVTNGCFAYNPARINIGSIAYNHETTFIVSPMYCVFTIRHEACNILNASYLNLWFRRKEFQRSTLFYATGSVRDIFDYNLMAEVNIPLPPIEVQQSIVALYNCAERARKIATEAREKLKTLCPALVQRAAHC